MYLSNERDFRKITQEEQAEYERIRSLEAPLGRKFGRINKYPEYPPAVKKYLSLFPNNYLVLDDLKKEQDLHKINEDFNSLIHQPQTKETNVLHFINHTPAFHIIGAILQKANFGVGHHGTYVFPEFRLGEQYRADYLIAACGAGGFEFVFVELESPNQKVVLKNGQIAKTLRDGCGQINDWKRWVENNFSALREFFEAEKNPNEDLPKEFIEFDSSRMHYVVVGGLRSYYNEEAYRNQREQTNGGVTILHYDNLYDYAEQLLRYNTF